MKFNTLYLLALILTLAACGKEKEIPDPSPVIIADFKQEMREFVIGISQYAKAINPDFIIVPQNGIELVTGNGDSQGLPHSDYLNAIDANGQEDLFYGYDNDDQSTSAADNAYLKELLNISKNAGNTILVTDYCFTQSKMTNSYIENLNSGYISFAAEERELSNIPDFPDPLHQENNALVSGLSQVKNFLYLINPSNFNSKNEFIDSVTASNYDLLIMDLFFNDGVEFTNSEIAQLKNKANGGKRLVISYLSIGEAENYRYYWQPNWNSGNPAWLDEENPDWEGNYKVKYWDAEWQNVIYGNENSYLKKVINADFDGVYLDLIDAFEYYEN